MAVGLHDINACVVDALPTFSHKYASIGIITSLFREAVVNIRDAEQGTSIDQSI
jgi:hypothetical protein